MDVPAPVGDIQVTPTPDLKSLDLKWAPVTTGYNGGYVNPDDVTYYSCLYNEETYSWEIAGEIGHDPEFRFTPNLRDGMALVQIGVIAANAQGNCGTLNIASGICGTPYSLPMKEEFGGQDGFNYSPVYGDAPDETYTSEFSFTYNVYPSWVDYQMPNGSAAFVAQSYTPDTKARVVLPPFCPDYAENAGIAMPVYTAWNSAPITVYAYTYGQEPVRLGTVSYNGNDGWTMGRFMLPESMLSAEWVQLYVDAEFSGDGYLAAFGGYEIRQFDTNDLAVISLESPEFSQIGKQEYIYAKVQNNGLKRAMLPGMQLDVTANGRNIFSADMIPSSADASLGDYEQASYYITYTPGTQAQGTVEYTVSLKSEDDEPANNALTNECIVAKGNQPLVTDLGAELTDAGVQLTWTDPAIDARRESFENMASFSYGDEVAGFTFYNRDDMESAHFGNVSFPHDTDQKAWQVISEREMNIRLAMAGIAENPMIAADGDKMLVAFPPLSYYLGSGYVADRWLITPELKPGSTVKFQLSAGMTGYKEDVEILYSTYSTWPDDFQLLDSFTMMTAEWKEYEYQLPEDACYLAIRYVGKTDDAFFLMADDFEMDPVDEGMTLLGYDIWRNSRLLAENQNVFGAYLDGETPESDVTYNVCPIVSDENGVRRGLISNPVTLEVSSVDGIEVADASVYGGNGEIVVKGLDGHHLRVCLPDGKILYNRATASDDLHLPAPAGIYIVTVDKVPYKISVR